MRVILNSIGQKSREISQKAIGFFRNERARRVAYCLVLAAASAITLWGGWKAALIATGKVPGISPSFLPASLPLLISGTLYIDRFAAVFCVMLAALLLLTFLQCTKGSLKMGMITGIVIFGVLTASTPLTLVAWLMLVGLVEEGNAPQKTRLRFLLGMGAIALSILLFSGGAFLADMTLVATITGQLPQGLISLALVLLFGGALWTIRDLKGAYLLVPAYIVLRSCLFFLGAVSAGLLTVTALLAMIAALYVAKMRAPQVIARTTFYLLLACVPLTMVAVQMETITAVQCFLFGGLAIAMSGLLTDTRGVWAKEWEHGGNILMRFFGSAIPGTLMGSASLLVLSGFWATGEAAGGKLERVYLALLAVLFVKTILLLARHIIKRNVEVADGVQFSGPLQWVMIAAASLGFAQVLAFLGTTIGGEVPDWSIDLLFATKTLSFMPAVCLVVGGVVVGLAYLLKTKNAEVWAKLCEPVYRAYAWCDAHTWAHRGWERTSIWADQKYRGINEWLEKIDTRMSHAPLKETVLVIIACFVVTLIALF